MVSYKNLPLPQVREVAALLAQTLEKPGAVIGLVGPLGAGKTTFVQAFARQLGVKKIASPTFVIRHDHPTKAGHLYHLDFYRLRQARQLPDLGLTELLTRPNLVLIEWVDKFPEIKKLCDLIITFKIKPQDRRDVSIQTN